MNENLDTSHGLLDNITESILDRKGENIVLINIKTLENAICDYFVICEATTDTQVSAIAHAVEERVKKNLSRTTINKNGYENAQWILLDYGEVIVHVFQTRYRNFYQLEDLWADGIQTTIESN